MDLFSLIGKVNIRLQLSLWAAITTCCRGWTCSKQLVCKLWLCSCRILGVHACLIEVDMANYTPSWSALSLQLWLQSSFPRHWTSDTDQLVVDLTRSRQSPCRGISKSSSGLLIRNACCWNIDWLCLVPLIWRPPLRSLFFADYILFNFTEVPALSFRDVRCLPFLWCFFGTRPPLGHWVYCLAEALNLHMISEELLLLLINC